MTKLTAVALDQLPKLVIETHSKLQEKEQTNQKEKMNRLLAQSQKALELKKTYEEHTKLFAFQHSGILQKVLERKAEIDKE